MTNSGCGSLRGAARGLALAALCAVAALQAAPAAAQGASTTGAPAGFELTRSVQQSLSRIQELWLRWMGASIRDDRARADEALRSLQATVREVGFHRLPDLALGAAAQARQAAKAGEIERARRQLEAAEALDPGRPEIAFARAAVARAGSDWFEALAATAKGFWLVARVEAARFAAASALLWVGTLLVVASGLFVALQAFVHGPEVVRALRERLEPAVSPAVSIAVVALLLLGPALLPSGLFCVLMLWSALLFAFVSKSERIVLAVGWAVVALVPLLSARVQREVALEQSPPLRAIEAFETRRLSGGLLPDLQVLRSALPSHPAALELAGDVHRTLGQWELARASYRRVLVDEPMNIPVLLNLGAYAFRKGDYAFANAYFQKATETGVPSAAAWFNLSVGYSAAYLFDESRQALERAREIDGVAVDAWIATENPDRVLTFNGSLARKEAIRAALVAAWADPVDVGHSFQRDLLRAATTLLVPAVLGWIALAAFGRPRRRGPEPLDLGPEPVERWLRALVPAFDAAEAGAGAWAFANLLLLAALLLLPWLFDQAGDLPLAGWPGPTVLGAIAILLTLGYAAIRIRLAGLVGTAD